MPRGANVTLADIVFDNNTIYSTTDQMIGFDLSILAGTQSVSLGSMDNRTTYYNEDLPMAIDYASAINSLMNNPMVPQRSSMNTEPNGLLSDLQSTVRMQPLEQQSTSEV